MKSNYIIPIFQPHRGCRHRCIFCNEWEYTGVTTKVEPADVEQTINQYLATIPKHPDIRIEVGFYGGSFTCMPIAIQEELLTPAHKAIFTGQINGIRLSTRPDCITPKIIEHLRHYGVDSVELGVQSMSEEVLHRAKRGHTAEDVRKAITLLKEAGLQVGAQLMVGLPGDDATTSLKTIQEIIALKTDFVRIHPTVVLKDTELADAYRRGAYQPLELEEAIQITKAMVLECEKHHVGIIRLGMHPSESLQDGAVVAGPFDPSFGEMVYSAIAFDLMEAVLKKAPTLGKTIQLLVPKGKESIFRGKRNHNLQKLKVEYPDTLMKIKEDASLSQNTIILKDESKDYQADLSSLQGSTSFTGEE